MGNNRGGCGHTQTWTQTWNSLISSDKDKEQIRKEQIRVLRRQ